MSLPADLDLDVRRSLVSHSSSGYRALIGVFQWFFAPKMPHTRWSRLRKQPKRTHSWDSECVHTTFNFCSTIPRKWPRAVLSKSGATSLWNGLKQTASTNHPSKQAFSTKWGIVNFSWTWIKNHRDCGTSHIKLKSILVFQSQPELLWVCPKYCAVVFGK